MSLLLLVRGKFSKYNVGFFTYHIASYFETWYFTSCIVAGILKTFTKTNPKAIDFFQCYSCSDEDESCDEINPGELEECSEAAVACHIIEGMVVEISFTVDDMDNQLGSMDGVQSFGRSCAVEVDFGCRNASGIAVCLLYYLMLLVESFLLFFLFPRMFMSVTVKGMVVTRTGKLLVKMKKLHLPPHKQYRCLKYCSSPRVDQEICLVLPM